MSFYHLFVDSALAIFVVSFVSFMFRNNARDGFFFTNKRSSDGLLIVANVLNEHYLMFDCS